MPIGPRWITLLVAWLVCCTQAFPQNTSGRITGTVTDTSGAVIPGAVVLVTDQATKLSWKTTTGSNGYYVVANLPAGTFDVEAEATGFRKARQTGYDLPANGRLTANFKLELGAVTETVVVQEVVGETVNTVSGELGNVISSEQVQDLALNGRNYLELVALVPGVALLDEDQMATTTSLSVTTQSVNGTRTNTGNLMVDGGMNLDSGSNGSQINNVGVGFIREMVVQTSAMSAEWGRSSGATINAVTKGGGNSYHGELLYTIRNDALDAQDYFAAVKPVLRFHDYSWNLGGPVAFGPLKKGKLFFFAGQEWKKIRKFTSPSRKTLPTMQELDGDFSDRTNNIRYPGTTLPIPGKNLAPLMTADGRAIMNVYRQMIKLAASYTNTPTSNNAIYQVLNPFNWRQDIVRIDFRPTDSNSIYFRWLHDNYDLVDPFGTFNASALPTTPTKRNRPGYGPQFGDLWTISPRVVNEFKINTSWNGQRTPLVGDAWKRSTYGFQFPLAYGGNGLYGNSIPNVSISGFTGFNGAAYVYLLSPTTDISISDNVTYLRGRQTIKVGAMLIRNRKDQNGRSLYAGSVAFNTSPNNATTGYALADAVLGNFSTYTEAANDPTGFFRFTQFESYVQDDVRVRRNLTLNIGMRFSYFIPTYAQANNLSNFDPARYDPSQAVRVLATNGTIVANSGNPYNGLIRAGNGIPSDQVGRVAGASTGALDVVPAGARRGFYPPYWLGMPRFGVAWAVNAKTSLRGGFGTFHDRVQGNLIFSQTLLPPFSGSATYESGNLNAPTGGTQAAQAVLGSINSISTNLKVPVVYNYNLNLERQLPAGLFLRLAYTGNQQRHLLRQPDINFPSFEVLSANYALPSAQRANTNAIRPYKGYSNIRMFLSDCNANYNALQTFLSKRKGASIFTVSYTWSHALTDTSSDTDNQEGGLGATVSRRYFHGPASFDRRHIFVVTYTYRLPFFARRRGVLRSAFGGWELSGVTRAQSGPSLTPTGSASGITRRADYVGGEIALPTDQRSPDRWFNTAAFKTASNSALGNAGPGSVVGPGLYTWDMTLRKVFSLNERGWKLRFEANGFNIMNHVNFRSLSATTTSGDYGSVTAAGPMRQIQGGVKLTF